MDTQNLKFVCSRQQIMHNIRIINKYVLYHGFSVVVSALGSLGASIQLSSLLVLVRILVTRNTDSLLSPETRTWGSHPHISIVILYVGYNSCHFNHFLLERRQDIQANSRHIMNHYNFALHDGTDGKSLFLKLGTETRPLLLLGGAHSVTSWLDQSAGSPDDMLVLEVYLSSLFCFHLRLPAKILWEHWDRKCVKRNCAIHRYW